MYFLQWTCLNFDEHFTEVCFKGSDWQYSIIGSENGLVPSRWQAIIWTNDDKFTDAYALLGLNELSHKLIQRSQPSNAYVHYDTFFGTNYVFLPNRCQAIIWINVRLLLAASSATYFSDIWIKLLQYLYHKIDLDSRLQNGGHFVPALIC